jgi:hypothetical protein
MTRSTTPDDEVMLKMKSYQLSDGECERLNMLERDFIASVLTEFGSRMHIAMTNHAASGLSHALLDPDEAFFVMENLNDWLSVTPNDIHGAGTQFKLVYRMEGDSEDVYTGRNTALEPAG